MGINWRKAISSGSAGGNRVELHWRKSSASGAGNDCIELAPVGLLRDSKNPDGPRIKVDIGALTSFARTRG